MREFTLFRVSLLREFTVLGGFKCVILSEIFRLKSLEGLKYLFFHNFFIQNKSSGPLSRSLSKFQTLLLIRLLMKFFKFFRGECIYLTKQMIKCELRDLSTFALFHQHFRICTLHNRKWCYSLVPITTHCAIIWNRQTRASTVP